MATIAHYTDPRSNRNVLEKMPSKLSKLITRRRFFAAVAGCGLALCGYTRFVEPHWMAVDEVRFAFPEGMLTSPVRVLLMSDLHVSDSDSIDFTNHAFTLGLSLEPDLICLAGDIIDACGYDKFALVETLKRLSRAAPTFACLGNHDGGNWVYERRGGHKTTDNIMSILNASHITCLHNAHQVVHVKGQMLRFVGLGDRWAKLIDPLEAFQGIEDPERQPTILLCHNPDSKDELKIPLEDTGKKPFWHLMLCGHTHGGQFVVPILGSTPRAPVEDKRYVAGLNRWRNRWIYTTRGIGNLYGMRFNCRPEVSLVTLI